MIPKILSITRFITIKTLYILLHTALRTEYKNTKVTFKCKSFKLADKIIMYAILDTVAYPSNI